MHGLGLREIGGGFTKHHRAPSSRAACYAIAKPSTMVQKMENIKKLRGHRDAVYCGTISSASLFAICSVILRCRIWNLISHAMEDILVKMKSKFMEVNLKKKLLGK